MFLFSLNLESFASDFFFFLRNIYSYFVMECPFHIFLEELLNDKGVLQAPSQALLTHLGFILSSFAISEPV